MKISIITGSLRKESFTRKIATAIKNSIKNADVQILEIGDLGLYNQDLDDTPPQEWTDFREKIKSSDGIIFCTPEYNRSIPGVLKNAIDIASRPYSENAFYMKSAAIVSVSPSSFGGICASFHLKQVASFLNMRIMTQPEMYVKDVAAILDEKGEIIDENTKNYISSFISNFMEWINIFK